jgi:hypothetical protein|tara:strand:+ start:169 stop:606 length:438 start_codon:yes stop_codon:yes gene_type:complete
MASKDDYTAIAIGIGALVLISKWALPKIPLPSLDTINILPEIGNFAEGFVGVDPGFYAEDQSGSPNPPTREFWESPEDEGPVAVWKGTQVPTPPIISTPDPRSPDRVAGQQTNDVLTNPIFYPWFWLGEKVLKGAADKTQANRFQ